MQAAIIQLLGDAAVSVLVIVGLLLARAFGWLWMDPLAGFIGALVIANWSFGLLRDTGGILLDRTPDPRMADKVRRLIGRGGSSRRPAPLATWARTSRRHRLGRNIRSARSRALPAKIGQARRPVSCHGRGPARSLGEWLSRTFHASHDARDPLAFPCLTNEMLESIRPVRRRFRSISTNRNRNMDSSPSRCPAEAKLFRRALNQSTGVVPDATRRASSGRA
jgi:hypothetical protein